MALPSVAIAAAVGEGGGDRRRVVAARGGGRGGLRDGAVVLDRAAPPS